MRVRGAMFTKTITGATRPCELDGKIVTHSLCKTFTTKIYHGLEPMARGEPVDAFRTTSKSKALGHLSRNSAESHLSFLEGDIE